jgi:PadR family transcriptional regulator PadR
MTEGFENWRTQIRKGYLELCILVVVLRKKRCYGLELIEDLASQGVPLKEGTLYPLLNRLTEDKMLSASWETEQAKGHPRKFYSLTKQGLKTLEDMREEFDRMVATLSALGNENPESKTQRRLTSL